MWVLYDPIKEAQTDKMTTEEIQFSILRLKTKYVNKYLIWRDDWPKWKKLKDYLESNDSPFMNMSAQLENNGPSAANDKVHTLKMSPAGPETIQRIKSSFEFSDVRVKEMTLQDITKGTAQQFDGDAFAELSESKVYNSASEAARNTAHLNFKTLNKTSSPGQRRFEDQFKIELLLIHPKGQMFRTVAQDISLTGTFTEKTVPPVFHNGVFDIVIINNMINDDEYKRLNLKATSLLTDSRIFIQFDQMTDAQKNSLRACLEYYVRMQKKIIEQT